jgi:hypothetical protein
LKSIINSKDKKVKVYKIHESRNKAEKYKYLIDTDDEILLCDSKNVDNGEPYFGSWTLSRYDFEHDSDIALFVHRI